MKVSASCLMVFFDRKTNPFRLKQKERTAKMINFCTVISLVVHNLIKSS